MSVLIIVVIVVGSSIGGILGAREFYFKEDTKKPKIAEKGDKIKIHYTGWLEDKRIYDSRRIFDTSYQDIPYVKDPQYTLTYSERKRGQPFEFTLGQGVIQGWNENVKGMEEGESKRFAVPPEKGYGYGSERLKFKVDKTETVPVYQEIDVDKFKEKYGRPGMNMIIEDPFWGWNKTIISIGLDTIMVRNTPDVGDTYHAYSSEGWKSKVVSIDSNANNGTGVIKIKHSITQPTVVNSKHLAKHDKRFEGIVDLKKKLKQSSNGEGIVFSNGDHITIDFNDEFMGKTLIFQVEIVSITKE